MVQENKTGPVDCACVIHGTAYSWKYVDTLYSMLNRHISAGVRLHVYTEPKRKVPEPYIKHALVEWPGVTDKRSWWYKMQLFNAESHQGPMLYFDLDVVIVRNLDWMLDLPLTNFWAIRDFKHLYKSYHTGINSSIMYWDTRRFAHVWPEFEKKNVYNMIAKYHGDQDYITEVIPAEHRRFFDQDKITSYRWQALDGGYNFQRKYYYKPNTGVTIGDTTSVLIFHGKPKPGDVTDPYIQSMWQ